MTTSAPSQGQIVLPLWWTLCASGAVWRSDQPCTLTATLATSQGALIGHCPRLGKVKTGYVFTDEIEYENQKRLEEEEDLNVLTFEDLLCFAYQVAKGMEFLEFKSVSTF